MLYASSGNREQERMKQKNMRDKEKGMGEEEGGAKPDDRNTETRTQSRVGPLPHAGIVVHLMEDWVPHGSFNISTKIFI